MLEHPNSLRIFGPAGSGKTRELVSILSEHVAEGDFNLAEGIIVSFTRAAANDIARRVNPDGAPGRYHCTIHALCKRYYGFEREFAEFKLKDFFRQKLIGYTPGASPDPEDWVTTASEERSEGALLLSFWNYCRNRMISLTEGKKLISPDPEIQSWWMGNNMERLFAAYVQWKADNNLVDFTDMLEYAVENPPQGYWPFLVLDEAQDNTPLQWAVIDGFAARSEVVYIGGDDDQAIYSWAGATPHEFLNARVTHSDVLRINYRSAGVIVDEAQRFIRRNKDRKDKNTVAVSEGGAINRLMAGELPTIDMSQSTYVMARAKYLNRPMMEKLTREAFPFVDQAGSYGVTGKVSTAYQRFVRLSRNQSISLDEWRLLMEGIPSAKWLTRGAKTRIGKVSKPERLAIYVRRDELRDYGATDELVNALKAGAIEVLEYVDQQRLGYLREVERRYGADYLDPLKAGGVCRVGSIHSFKGLECDHAVINGSMPKRAFTESLADPEPERRVFYVGMTRAKSEITHYTTDPGYRWEAIL